MQITDLSMCVSNIDICVHTHISACVCVLQNARAGITICFISSILNMKPYEISTPVQKGLFQAC